MRPVVSCATILGCLLVAAPGVAAEGRTIHVAPTGDDQAVGDRGHPVATLMRARDLAREGGGDRPQIIVHGGAFYDVALTLTERDSGLTIAAAAGEHPVWYGGIPLTGWKPEGDRWFATALSARPDQTWQPRMLLVDGQMRPRARLPAEGTFTHLTTFTVRWLSSTAGGWERKPTEAELTTLQYRPGDLGTWFEPKNAEVTVFHMWDDSCVGVTANNPATQRLTLSPACGHPPGGFGVQKYVVWNLREGLTAPGQWCHDRIANRIIYWPLSGQDPTQSSILVPTQESIVRISGTKSAPAKDITLRGITLSVTTVPLVAGGFAADRYPGALALEQTEGCTVERVVVRAVAGQGISSKASNRARILDCEVAECGAGGIYAGGRETEISGNRIQGIGRTFPAAIGIYRGGTACRVAHNEVHDCSYSGINYGGTENVIEGNLVYDCMRTLHDGAAIYLFAAKRCVIRGNFVRDIVDTGGYGASAFYLDEQSEGCVVEGNLSRQVGWPTQNHLAHDNVLRNNLFLVTGEAKLSLPRSRDYTFTHNIVAATGKITINGVQAVTTWSQNILHSGSGVIEAYRMEEYKRVGPPSGPPGDTVTADPLLAERAPGVYVFKPGSLAPGMGIVPVDVHAAGRGVP
jgi:Right handed beta helix region